LPFEIYDQNKVLEDRRVCHKSTPLEQSVRKRTHKQTEKTPLKNAAFNVRKTQKIIYKYVRKIIDIYEYKW